ncbi:class I SAM-dependent methyltransferase [Marinibaculum pumilum]|uniref:Class I SAM-dependent methyltransferase n=1 Tax=Marinibaculum pumilum TaxID=1766165 RepID=A0ABV7KYL8_9PROT
MRIHKGLDRYGICQLLPGTDNIGIELGVAAGVYSARLVASGKFSQLYGVDRYGDHHDVDEYRAALKAIGLESNFKLLRMTFDQALDLFPDGMFDFVYIDGFAHTGELGGRLFFDWMPKVKPEGILAGDDYDPKWPLVIEAVDYFVGQLGVELNLTDPECVHAGPNELCPSWFVYPGQSTSTPVRNRSMEEQGAALALSGDTAVGDRVTLGTHMLRMMYALEHGGPPEVSVNGRHYILSKVQVKEQGTGG